MKKTIDGKRYDSKRCEKLASYIHYSDNNNYCGVSHLALARDGVYLTVTLGQDLHLQDNMQVCDDPVGWLEGVEISDAEERRLVDLGLLTLV